MPENTFNPPVRTLLGPGPSDVYPEVLEALSKPTVGHLDPYFINLMDQTKELLQYAFRTNNQLTMPVSAPGSAGMETCLMNLIEPGDKTIVCINGVFGGRMRDIVERIGGTPVVVEDEWGRPVDPEKVEKALKDNPEAKYVAFVHAETSTGARSDVKELVALAHKYDCLAIVDAVTSLGGIELRVDDWNIDAIYSGSQKCLSCIPGLSPISFNDRALEIVRNRKSKVKSWFLDLNLVMQYWGSGKKRSYHHTAPVNSIYALYEALRILKREGLENSWKRHYDNHLKLKAGLEKLGLEFVVEEQYRLPQLNAVRVPDGVDEANVRKRLLENHNIEIGAGLGDMAGKIWRIGLMGCASNEKNIQKVLDALETIMAKEKATGATAS
jgi:alanine-glyoxylate transaminase/serine-glyoxylate transaminase/serine-pyruvate transaminase